MNELLRRYLEPDDDGRAFTEAVLLRAAGALHLRRSAHEAADALPWTALEAWARPAETGLRATWLGLAESEASRVSHRRDHVRPHE